MRKSGNKKAIKNIVQRNLQSEKRRNVMLMISIALASFLICFSGLIATSLLEVKKKQIQDTYEAVYMNVSEEKLLKLREETGFERVGQYYIVGDIPSDKKYTATFFLHGSANALYDEKSNEFIQWKSSRGRKTDCCM
ncbi:MAG: hypothetical protein ACLR7S_14240 [Dorea longicatena]